MVAVTTERAYWLAWSKISGVGPVALRRMQEQFGSLAIAWNAPPTSLLKVHGLGNQTVESIQQQRSHLNPAALLAEHEPKNPHFWTPADPDYPRLLLEIPDPPPLLYYNGIVDPLENQGIVNAIAIVGTRNPTPYGRLWTKRLTAGLVKAGFTIVSGLAVGIDTEAHTVAVQQGGRSLAVLGSAVDIIYPNSNRGLAKHLSQQGLILSEYPAGTPPDRLHFPRRNRIIAGLCRAVIVIEASEKSGALITARLANEYGRDVYILPGSLDNPQSRGCLGLLNQGAQVILGVQELLDSLGAIPKLDASSTHATSDDTVPGQLSLLSSSVSASPAPEPFDLSQLTPALQQVYVAVPVDAIAFDHIVQTTNLPTGEVLSALTQLEMLGAIASLPGGKYQRG